MNARLVERGRSARAGAGHIVILLLAATAQAGAAHAQAVPNASSPTSPSSPPVTECFPACRAGYLCHQGQCVSACNPACAPTEMCTLDGTCVANPAVAAPAPVPVTPAPVAVTPTPVPVTATPLVDVRPADPKVGGTNLHVNALGVLQFGLIPRLELGGSSTLLLGAHLFNTGVASYVAIGGDDEKFSYGYGGNVGLRHYTDSQRGQAGFYLGAFLEYARVETQDDVDDLAIYTTDLVIPALEFGTRWVWGQTLLDFGLLVGAALPVGAKDKPLGEDGCAWESSCLEERDPYPFAMLVLDIGLFFSNQTT